MAHGLSCCTCLPQVVEFIAPVLPDKVKLIAEALGGMVPRGSLRKLAASRARQFRKL